MREVFEAMDKARDDQDQWCSREKADGLASLVLAMRPRLVVEIGVWRGASCLPMVLALRHNGNGMCLAIDAWSPEVSATGELPKNAQWWGSVDHEQARADFLRRLSDNELQRFCKVVQAKSDDVPVPEEIGLLHVDGSHTEQAVRDVERFAPSVPIGGVLVLDDIGWQGDGVKRAHALAQRMGFVDQYDLGSGCVLFRHRIP